MERDGEGREGSRGNGGRRGWGEKIEDGKGGDERGKMLFACRWCAWMECVSIACVKYEQVVE